MWLQATFPARRHQVHSRGTDRFSVKAVFGELGVLQLSRIQVEPPFVSLR